MDVFHLTELEKLKYIYLTIDVNCGFQWTSAISPEKTDSIFTHLLETMAVMGVLNKLN